jgi:hypothetical protein
VQYRPRISSYPQRFDGCANSLDTRLQFVAAIHLSATGSLPPTQGSHRHHSAHRRGHASRCGDATRPIPWATLLLNTSRQRAGAVPSGRRGRTGLLTARNLRLARRSSPATTETGYCAHGPTRSAHFRLDRSAPPGARSGTPDRHQTPETVELRKRSKWRSINDAGWSSLVARRAHNPKVVSSNLTPATN